MGERTLTTRELNRAVLARQGLLQRHAASLPRALERVGGIQAQYAPSIYVGLWSRVEGVERAAVTAALERRSAVQATLMRATIHVVSKADYWPMRVATAAVLRAWWVRTHTSGPPRAEVEAGAERLRRRLAEGPAPRREVEALLGKDVARHVGFWMDLVRVPPSGTWERRRADLYGLAEDWVGPCTVGEHAARVHLVRRYLAGFGPATRADVAAFAGIGLRDLAPALDELRLRRFRSVGGEELLDLPRAPLPDGEAPAAVRFLPTWDAVLLVHARRTLVLPEDYRPRIFHTRNPHSSPTFLVDGQVAGTWRHEGGRITVEPFHPLSKGVRREVDDEAERLAAFHA